MVYVCMCVCGACLVCQEEQARQQVYTACRRQWCRVLVQNKKRGKWKGPLKDMLDFFTVYPGLQMFIGGLVLRFYDPATADSFGKRKRCSIS